MFSALEDYLHPETRQAFLLTHDFQALTRKRIQVQGKNGKSHHISVMAHILSEDDFESVQLLLHQKPLIIRAYCDFFYKPNRSSDIRMLQEASRSVLLFQVLSLYPNEAEPIQTFFSSIATGIYGEYTEPSKQASFMRTILRRHAELVQQDEHKIRAFISEILNFFSTSSYTEALKVLLSNKYADVQACKIHDAGFTIWQSAAFQLGLSHVHFTLITEHPSFCPSHKDFFGNIYSDNMPVGTLFEALIDQVAWTNGTVPGRISDLMLNLGTILDIADIQIASLTSTGKLVLDILWESIQRYAVNWEAIGDFLPQPEVTIGVCRLSDFDYAHRILNRLIADPRLSLEASTAQGQAALPFVRYLSILPAASDRMTTKIYRTAQYTWLNRQLSPAQMKVNLAEQTEKESIMLPGLAGFLRLVWPELRIVLEKYIRDISKMLARIHYVVSSAARRSKNDTVSLGAARIPDDVCRMIVGLESIGEGYSSKRPWDDEWNTLLFKYDARCNTNMSQIKDEVVRRAKQELSRLKYDEIIMKNEQAISLVGTSGIEPPTPTMSR